jgi:glycogen phosphorylase
MSVRLNGLNPDDVIVELLVSRAKGFGTGDPMRHRFVSKGADATGEHHYALEFEPELCGRLDYRIRAYPWHQFLTHPFELGLMIWA